MTTKQKPDSATRASRAVIWWIADRIELHSQRQLVYSQPCVPAHFRNPKLARPARCSPVAVLRAQGAKRKNPAFEGRVFVWIQFQGELYQNRKKDTKNLSDCKHLF